MDRMPVRGAVLALAVLAGCSAPPQLSQLAVVAQDFTAGIAFSASDPNHDLNGGAVHLTFGGGGGDYPISSQDPSQEGKGVLVSLAYLYSACDASGSAAVSLYATDAKGNQSNPLAQTVSLTDVTRSEREPNDNYGQQLRYDGTSFGICGNISSTGTDNQSYYSGDLDYYDVTATSSGTVTIVLRQGLHNYFDLWFNNTASYARDAPEGVDYRYTKLTEQFHAGSYYEIMVAAGSGSGGQYSLSFQ